MSKARRHRCPACGSYSTSAAVVTKHYRQCFWRGVDKTDPRAMREATRGLYTDIARDLDADEAFDRSITAARGGDFQLMHSFPEDVAATKLAKRAPRSAARNLRKQGVSRRRAAEMMYLMRGGK